MSMITFSLSWTSFSLHSFFKGSITRPRASGVNSTAMIMEKIMGMILIFPMGPNGMVTVPISSASTLAAINRINSLIKIGHRPSFVLNTGSTVSAF